MPRVVMAEGYANFDADVQSTDSGPHDDDILGEFLQEEMDDREGAIGIVEGIAHDVVEICPSVCDFTNAIDVISLSCLLSWRH